MPFIVLLLLSFSTTLYAKNISSVFSYSTEYEYDYKDRIELKGNKLYVNNKQMVKYQLDMNSKEFRMILGEFKTTDKSCARGTYNLVRFDGTKETVEKGCIYGQRFKVLKKAFKVLKANTPLIKLK